MICCSAPASPVSGTDQWRGLGLDSVEAAAAFDLEALASDRPSATPTEGLHRVATSPGTRQPSAATSPGTRQPNAATSPSAAPTNSSTVATALIAPAQSPRTFVALGDSLSAWAFTPGAKQPSKTGSWPTLLSSKDRNLKLLHNAGVPGNTTAQMLARFKRDVLSYHPDMLLILGGTNDVGYGLAVSTTVGNIRRIVESAKAHGIEVVLLTIPPNNDISKSKLSRLRQTNRALIQLGRAEGITVVDVYAALASTSGQLPAAYAAADHLHLTQRGEAVLAAAVYAQLTRPAPRLAR